MALDTNLINAFAEQVTSAEDILDSGEYYNGTVKIIDGKNYVQIDGSSTITPVAVSSVGLKDGNRVSCTIKDHRLSVVANMSDPSANKTEVDEVKTKIIEVNTLIAEKVSTKDFEAKVADIEDLKADKATVEQLKADMLTADTADIRYAKIKDLEATDAKIDNIKAGMVTADDIASKYATIENLKTTNETVTNLQGTYATFEKTVTEELKANKASIEHLDADKLDANTADLKYATIKNLDATNADVSNLSAKQANFESATAGNFTAVNADIETLRANKMDVDTANAKFANIDFANITEAAVKKIFSDSGIIKDLIVSEGKITGELVGVTIKGDLIEGGTVVADKLVVKGSNGLYYKLNTDGVTTEAEQTEYNSLNGSVIAAKSITATKIAVDDLVAFGATIAGYTIRDHALYSGAKTSATNTTRGVYMNDDGEFSIGDADNFLRFWKDTDGQYKLAISAKSIMMSSSGTDIETAINNAQSAASSAEEKSSTALSNASQALTKANTTAKDLTDWKTSYTQDISGFKQTVEKTYATKSTVDQLQNIADAAIETWTGDGVPSLTTLPASKWNTDALKKQHSGDVYYDNKTGYAYRFGSADGSAYSWSRIKDSDITSALNKADAAQTTASNAQKNLDNYKDTVSNTYVTKTSFEQTASSIASKVEAAQTTANSATTAASKAQQTAESVSLNLSKNYSTTADVNKKIDDISVGGRNLLLGSLSANGSIKNEIPGWEYNGNTSSIALMEDINGEQYIRITKIDSAADNGYIPSVQSAFSVELQPNSTYIYTIWLRMVTNDFNGSMSVPAHYWLYALKNRESYTLLVSDGTTPNASIKSTVATSLYYPRGKWVKQQYIIKTGDAIPDHPYTYFKPFVYGKNAGTITTYRVVDIKGAKLEVGNKPTDWSPAPEDLQPAGDYATKSELKATSDSITASVSKVETVANTANTKIDNLKVGGRNLVLGTGVAKTVTGTGGTNECGASYNLVRSLQGLGLSGVHIAETYEFMIDKEPSSSSTLKAQYFGGNIWPSFGAVASIALTSSHVGVYTKISVVATHSFTSSQDATSVQFRLDNYTGTLTVRNIKLEFGTTATDWSPAPEDMATTNQVDEVKSYSEAQLKILSDNISTLVTDAAGKSMMKQTSSGWTFDMSTIQNEINKNANQITSVAGDLSNADKAISNLNTNVNSLLLTAAYISIGTDSSGAPRLELGKKDSPFRVAISNTSIDFLEGTDKIAYISNKQLYIYSSVVTDELKIGDSTGYIWKRRANNHLGLRYVTS